jgi:hypothetical protein
MGKRAVSQIGVFGNLFALFGEIQQTLVYVELSFLFSKYGAISHLSEDDS